MGWVILFRKIKQEMENRKKVREWFESVKYPEVRELLLERMNSLCADLFLNDLCEAILVGFPWGETPEGHLFWLSCTKSPDPEEYLYKHIVSLQDCKHTPNLKLYVWTEVLTNYHDGMAFALAESVDDARELIIQKYTEEEGYEPGERLTSGLDGLEKDPIIVDTRSAFYIHGGE